MDSTTVDDNFFIEEPQKLRNNFYNKDKSLQIVELLAQKHHHETPITKQQKVQQFHPFSISFMMKKPDLKTSSAEHITQLLRKVQHTLDYRDHKAIDWLSSALDEHFVELVKTDDAFETIDQLSAYVENQCALMREVENTKSLIKPISDMIDKQHTDRKNLPNGNSSSSRGTSQQHHTLANQRIYHTVDYIEF